MSTSNTFLDGKPFKIITVAMGDTVPPYGHFRFVRPTGSLTASWKGKSAQLNTDESGDDHSSTGVYSSGSALSESSPDIGMYTNILVTVGTVKAYYW